MKKIIILVIVLFTAIVAMAYLYFSRLNAEQKNSDNSLNAAVANSSFVFSLQNDKSVLDILKGQELFSELVGPDNFKQMTSIKNHLLSVPSINQLIGQQNIYISLIPGTEKSINILYCTQLGTENDKTQLLTAIKAHKIQFQQEDKITKLTLPDSTVFYLGIKENLVLLSDQSDIVKNTLSTPFSKNNKFAEYLKANSRLTKNSLAELHINFETLPALLKSTMPGKLDGELSALNQDAFASFAYNFSRDRILLTGSTKINDADNYFQLFAAQAAQKITISNILPNNTANYAVYSIGSYTSWKSTLNEWFVKEKANQAVTANISRINEKYHIDLDQIFPKYFKDQVITFQLGTSEKLGAINLTNGDKVDQLLLELSSNENEDIKLFREHDLLYAYFGLPFKKFGRPYYTIIDNYMIVANNSSTIQAFLNSYKNDQLLINSSSYTEAVNQLPNTAGITCFIDFKNSEPLFRRNIYLPYYRHIMSEKGLKAYTSFIYQMSGDNGKFQTNLLLNRKIQSSVTNSDALQNDSLTILP